MQDALVAFKERFGMYPPDGTDQHAPAIPGHRLPALHRAACRPGLHRASTQPFDGPVFLAGRMPEETACSCGFSANPNPFDTIRKQLADRRRSILHVSIIRRLRQARAAVRPTSTTRTTALPRPQHTSNAPYVYFSPPRTAPISRTGRSAGNSKRLCGHRLEQQHVCQPDDVPDPLPRPGRSV